MLTELVCPGRRVRAQHDERRDRLSPFLVRKADDRDIGNRGVPQQYILDLGRCDVLGTADDRVVGAPADKQKAALVEVPLVTRVEESAGIDGRPGTGVLRGHLLAAHPDASLAT